jgi:hypothetical protein
MTTVHDLDETTQKLRRRPGPKSTNAKNARPAFEGYDKKEMPIPTCFDDYNHHMGGVDIADQSPGVSTKGPRESDSVSSDNSEHSEKYME